MPNKNLEDLIDNIDNKETFTARELRIILEISKVSSALIDQSKSFDKINQSIYDLKTDLLREVNNLEKKHSEEIKIMKKKIEEHEKFIYKMSGALIVLSLIWAYVLKNFL